MPLDFPLNPVNGQTYLTYTYDASIASWRSNPLVKGPAYISDTVPSLGANGDMWFNSADGTMFVRYNGNWVEARSDETVTPGSIVQVVQGTTNMMFSTSSTSFVDTGLSATITPKFSNSKVLVSVSQTGFAASSNTATNNNNYIGNIVRGSTQLISCSNQVTVTGQTIWSNTLEFLDAPSTISAIVYKTQAMVTNSSNGLYLQWPPPSGTSTSVITLMEVAQ